MPELHTRGEKVIQNIRKRAKMQLAKREAASAVPAIAKTQPKPKATLQA